MQIFRNRTAWPAVAAVITGVMIILFGFLAMGCQNPMGNRVANAVVKSFKVIGEFMPSQGDLITGQSIKAAP